MLDEDILNAALLISPQKNPKNTANPLYHQGETSSQSIQNIHKKPLLGQAGFIVLLASCSIRSFRDISSYHDRFDRLLRWIEESGGKFIFQQRESRLLDKQI